MSQTRCIVLVAAFVVLGLAAGPAGAKVRVVATLSDFASIAESVGGDRVEVGFIADGKVDAHYVQILPSYMLQVQRADLLLRAGLDLEPWVRGVVDGARNRNLVQVDCSEGVEVLNVPTGPVSAKQGDIHLSGNPHYWLDPANGIPIARNVAQALIDADPEGADYYLERLAAFEAALTAKLEEWEARMAPHAGTEIVYFHDSWPYFNQRFGLVAAGFLEPKPGISPSAGHTARIVSLMRERGIRVVAMAPYFNRKVPESVARQADADVVTLAVSVGGVEGADDYIALFDRNLERLLAVLETR